MASNFWYTATLTISERRMCSWCQCVTEDPNNVKSFVCQCTRDIIAFDLSTLQSISLEHPPAKLFARGNIMEKAYKGTKQLQRSFSSTNMMILFVHYVLLNLYSSITYVNTILSLQFNIFDLRITGNDHLFDLWFPDLNLYLIIINYYQGQ